MTHGQVRRGQVWTDLLGEMKGMQSSRTKKTSAYRKVATAVHCRLILTLNNKHKNKTTYNVSLHTDFLRLHYCLFV